MSFLNKYPYTDFHELNLDWILEKLREMGVRMDEFEAVNTITFSGTWDITSQYPAWTVVSDNNIGYISIQPVPAGIVLTNTDYWRVIIDYTAQIAGMQTQINVINSILALGKWLFIGDSYEVYGNWYSKVIARLGLTNNVNAFYCGGSGHGFTISGGAWETDFDTFCSGRTDLDDFKHIVFVGGLNDSTTTALASDGALLRAAVRSFFSDAWSKMKNANLAFAYVGSGLSDSGSLSGRTSNNRFTAINILKDEFISESNATNPRAHGYFLEGPQYALHAPGCFVSDGIHPSAYGATQIVKAVTEAILNGGCANVSNLYATGSAASFASGDFSALGGYVSVVENSRSKLVLKNVAAQNTGSAYTISTTVIDLGALPSGVPIYNSTPVDVFAQKANSGSAGNLLSTLWIANGHLYIQSCRTKAGPVFETMTVAVGDRVDLGTLTFDELTLFTQ